MTETAQLTETDAWLDAFEALEQSAPQGPAWLLPLRKAGLAQFAKTGLPTLKDEDWRFTNVDPVRQLTPNPSITRSDLDAAALDQVSYPHKGKETIRLVLLRALPSGFIRPFKIAGRSHHPFPWPGDH